MIAARLTSKDIPEDASWLAEPIMGYRRPFCQENIILAKQPSRKIGCFSPIPGQGGKRSTDGRV
jgi:hypothetical protein